jgi:DNA-directed RNA polymerase specialized sigma subunit
MGVPSNRLSILESSSAAGPECPLSSSENSSAVASQETETASLSRHVLPKNLDAAIKQLDDQDLDRLVSVALEERARRKRPPVPKESQRKRNAEAVSPSLPQGKLNAVRAAFKAGVTPARIAREFGISRSGVQRALAGEAKK